MVGNLAVDTNQIKSFRLTRSDARLVGWCGWLLKRSKKPWIHLCLPTFCKATGIGLRTAKRSLQKIRTSPETEIIARTINEKGVWKVLVSSAARLHGLQRSEPFIEMKEIPGRRVASPSERIVKTHIRGERILEEQLILNKDPVLWKAVAHYSGGVGVSDANASLPKEDPNQLTLNELIDPPNSKSDTNGHPLPKQEAHYVEQMAENPLSQNKEPGRSIKASSTGATTKLIWSQNRECHFSPAYNRDNISDVIKFKHGQADFGVKTRNLAWYIARNDLRNEHWDNCKVAHTMNHSFTYALQALRRGCNRRTIIRAYSMALEEIHAIAVDSGVTEPASWPPSSTTHRARKLLADGGCFGQWSRRVARGNQSQKIIVSADT